MQTQRLPYLYYDKLKEYAKIKVSRTHGVSIFINYCTAAAI
jgi:hypothetical protein